MKKTIALAAFAFAFAAAAFAVNAQDKQTATANFVDAKGKETGRATLTAPANGGVFIEAEIAGLPANKWVAFHVHETGKCDPATHHESAGKHFNPTKAEHGFLAAKGPHAGDLPNQYVAEDGVMRAQIYSTLVRLDDKERGIRGRALIVHAGSDDNRTDPAGGAGDRLACAVIR